MNAYVIIKTETSDYLATKEARYFRIIPQITVDVSKRARSCCND